MDGSDPDSDEATRKEILTSLGNDAENIIP